MSGKEATVFVLDVGRSMGRKNQGRTQSDLDWALLYAWDKITSDIATGRKTLFHGVLGFRTDGTENDMPPEEAYEHITVFQQILNTTMPHVRSLQRKLKASKTDDGDVLSAIVTAGEMIASHCKALKFTKKIVVITNGNGMLDASDVEPITARIKDLGIELIVLGVDFNDEQFGFKEENKDELKAQNEMTLWKMADDCGGAFGTLAEAIEEMATPRVKVVNSVPTYRGFLSLGDPEKYETAMCIDIERIARTMTATAPTATKFAVKSGPAGNEDEDVDMDAEKNGHGPDLASLEQKTNYKVADATAPGGKRDVEREDLAKGFEYGRTVVPVSESDQLVLAMETKAAYEIVGFIPEDSYPHYMSLSRTNVIIAQRTNDKAIMALSSFIHALYEAESHAVARFVQKDGKSPVLVLLSQEITKDYECLYENELPFHEDIRSYKFPPLDYILTVSGKNLKVHRNLPNEELQDAMDSFVGDMNLSLYGTDDKGVPAEYMAVGDAYAVLNHRLQQVIKYRAVHPDDGLPPMPEVLMKPERPPQGLLRRAAESIMRLEKAADAKKVPPKAAFKKGRRTAEQPISGLDVSKLLQGRAKSSGSRIDPNNVIPTFLQFMDQEGVDDGRPALELAKEGIAQMSKIIEGWIKTSFGDMHYDRVLETLGEMRKVYVQLEEPGPFNEYLKRLKGLLLGEALDGDRREMWFKLRTAKLGLIKKSEVSDDRSQEDGLDDEEARKFWATT